MVHYITQPKTGTVSASINHLRTLTMGPQRHAYYTNHNFELLRQKVDQLKTD